MATSTFLKDLSSLLITAVLSLCFLLIPRPATAQAPAGPVAQPPYVLSVFATSTDGYSQPDSLVQWGQSFLVGFQNHVAKDGSDGKSSTIVQYSTRGAVERTFSVKGHNDGLRLIGGELWALQNEDANPNLVVINLNAGTQATYTFPPTPHGGGYDDMVVYRGQVLMTASNPALNTAGVNVFPALVQATLTGNTVTVIPVLYGNAAAVDIPIGTAVSLNLTDPDSLAIDPRGNVVLDSQADGELVIIHHALEADQAVGRINIRTAQGPITVDDTAFATKPRGFLLVSDVQGDTVYRISSPTYGFEPGAAYSASDTAGIVGALNLDNGALTPIATGFGSARGMVFAPSTRFILFQP